MTTKAQILKTIREYCIGCSGGVRDEVARCTVTDCELYPYRMGKDPHPVRKGPKVLPWHTKNKNDKENMDDTE